MKMRSLEQEIDLPDVSDSHSNPSSDTFADKGEAANMIAAVESILSQTGATDETKNLIRHQVSSLLMAHRPRDVLFKVERDALKEERADNDLVIVPADETENRLGHAQIIQHLKFCLKTYFTFDGTIYEQVKGTPMGLPISGLIADAVLQRLESLVFRHHRPKFWARYVDDTFVVIERDQMLTFKEQLNAVFPDIHSTMEKEEKEEEAEEVEEENNQLAFLDVLVCRKDCGGLKTKVFRKATNTTQKLNFNSNHPISHKCSCVEALYRRVETHCSEMGDKVAELQYLRRVLFTKELLRIISICPLHLRFKQLRNGLCKEKLKQSFSLAV
nr:unnamed protein product [Spirometra erinaceieuropaei]